MKEREILTWPTESLSKVSEEIILINDKIKSIASDLVTTMYANPYAVGLAAPQIGENIRMFCIDVWWKGNFEKRSPIVFINPTIIPLTESKYEYDEGCLSVPGIHTKILRPERISVEYNSLTGDKCSLNADSFMAQVIQHENDHLNGVLFIEHIWGARKERLMKKYNPPKHGKYLTSDVLNEEKELRGPNAPRKG